MEGNRSALGRNPTILGSSEKIFPLGLRDKEFDKFEDLAQKIVQVPKSEIDEKRGQ